MRRPPRWLVRRVLRRPVPADHCEFTVDGPPGYGDECWCQNAVHGTRR